MTAKNQLTLPKAITNAIGPTQYFDVKAKDGQIVLTPVRIQRADAQIIVSNTPIAASGVDPLRSFTIVRFAAV